jgi:hypothetical protein
MFNDYKNIMNKMKSDDETFQLLKYEVLQNVKLCNFSCFKVTKFTMHKINPKWGSNWYHIYFFKLHCLMNTK